MKKMILPALIAAVLSVEGASAAILPVTATGNLVGIAPDGTNTVAPYDWNIGPGEEQQATLGDYALITSGGGLTLPLGNNQAAAFRTSVGLDGTVTNGVFAFANGSGIGTGFGGGANVGRVFGLPPTLGFDSSFFTDYEIKFDPGMPLPDIFSLDVTVVGSGEAICAFSLGTLGTDTVDCRFNFFGVTEAYVGGAKVGEHVTENFFARITDQSGLLQAQVGTGSGNFAEREFGTVQTSDEDGNSKDYKYSTVKHFMDKPMDFLLNRVDVQSAGNRVRLLRQMSTAMLMYTADYDDDWYASYRGMDSFTMSVTSSTPGVSVELAGTSGVIPEPSGFAVWLLLSACFAVGGWRFYRAERRSREQSTSS